MADRKPKPENLLKTFRLADKDQSVYINPDMVKYTIGNANNTTTIVCSSITYIVAAHSGIITKYLEPVQGSFEGVKRKERDDHQRRD